MRALLTDLVERSRERAANAPALMHRQRTLDYDTLAAEMDRCAAGLRQLGLQRDERVAIFLGKQPETIVAFLGAARAGGVFVPVNPILKPAQVGHILRDCSVRILVTQNARLQHLADELAQCPELRTVILTDGTDVAPPETGPESALATTAWTEMMNAGGQQPACARRIDTDMAAILYTSGSTGRPKGVVLSHRNMVAGAESVASYLENRPADRLLSVLPLSFDYGLSQLTTAFHTGASAVLMDYLLPRDVLRGVERFGITGLACVPPLWNQLARLEWPDAARSTLRYITNSGGSLPRSTLDALRTALPATRVYLMYGLTEAFRSTYLPPEQIDQRPESMGRAIPNAEIRVVREDGSECDPEETGELVHRGALVALGYWNDPERTAGRFRPAPGQPPGLSNPELAVWSGDRVRRDAEGYLYFVGRDDAMIKSSGYRISPNEIEEVAYGAGSVDQAIALGVPHDTLGQGIVLLIQADEARVSAETMLEHCRQQLPGFMVPHAVRVCSALPINPNGKIDRSALEQQYRDLLTASETVS